MKWVCSKGTASDASKSVCLSQKWDYNQLHSNYGKVLHLACWYVMCVLIRKPEYPSFVCVCLCVCMCVFVCVCVCVCRCLCVRLSVFCVMCGCMCLCVCLCVCVCVCVYVCVCV